MRIVSWNINGIRAAVKKQILPSLTALNADIICFQETKAAPDQIPVEILSLEGYQSVFELGERKGYSGVGTLCRIPFKTVGRSLEADEEFDSEGRILITEHPDFLLYNIYFPNGQKDEIRLDYKLRFYDAALCLWKKRLQEGKEIVICGDFNTAHREIDIARPKENEMVSGFLKVERDWMDTLEDAGFIDTFRHLHPDQRDAYTWWSMRTNARIRNTGWRLDYFYVSPGLEKRIRKAEILPEIAGSDHCPVLLELA